ncbi:hypothetical protein [Polyangium spumosum]|uniref:Uncharacterized protein n=1 Tax=Polyangium spumosum TaxID=889282 RepID=A0A6N7PLL5_9BACT|nr:hypothetical protein [Polyangium spumosum]MRG91034.1 hypothetical protein [Polyangium spumosum]
MKREHKLRLVRPDERVTFEDEPPPSPEELAEADALRAALEKGEHPLAVVLRSASAPAGIDDALNDALIERALGNHEARAEGEDEPPTASERAGATRLRDALESARGEEHGAPLVELAAALVAAHRPRAIEPLRNEALIARALRRASAEPRKGRVLSVVTAAVVMAAAAAAGFVLTLQPSSDSAVAEAPELSRSRSAGELFDTPFPRVGGASARVDRIASTRATELRQNRFALWGVR